MSPCPRVRDCRTDCYGGQVASDQVGYGTCKAPAATRSASSEGGDNLGPDDPSKYLSIDEAKARALKELKKAKADPLAAFAKWLKDNKKSYAADSELGKLVYVRFLEVIETGIKHNSDPDTLYAMGLTGWLDGDVLSGPGAERRSLQTSPTNSPYGAPPTEPNAPVLEPFGAATPGGQGTCALATMDNRAALLPAEQQGSCGSCWTFATAAAVQAQAFSGAGQPPYLSKQQLVDCAVTSENYPSSVNKGCNGGSAAVALEYIKSDGLLLETDYPYEEGRWNSTQPIRKTCRSGLKVNKPRYYIPDFLRLAQNENTMLEEMCERGAKAMIIRIDVCPSFMAYKGGILDADCPPGNNGHIITIVGYGTATVSGKSVPYWLVRNSWGANWGDPSFPGYVRIKRGVNLAGVRNYAYRLYTPFLKGGASSPPPPAADPFASCYSSKSWMDGVYRAWRNTSYGNSWAVASTSSCSSYGYSFNMRDQRTAEQLAVTACQNYHGKPCALMRSGVAVCTNKTRIDGLKTWVEGRAGDGMIYTVAINGTCGPAYGRWSNSNWTFINGAVDDCNKKMASDYNATAASPCGIVLQGQKGSTTYKCMDPKQYNATRAKAIGFTKWGYAWALFTDPGCGNQWYNYNWATLAQAQKSNSTLGKCNAAALAKYGPAPCMLVDSGVAQCTDSAKWKSTVDLARSKCSPGKSWAVWMDKTCSLSYYAYNYNTVDDALTSEWYDKCNKAAVDKGLSDLSCGAVAWDTVPKSG
ncbi:hypothetical protein HYH03_013360 [Edaphochlamys debaryana]|uniref:Peptidase C1A papain C-terminal domain-containing protein n=1 Tax=Edaphochlamys debaryana TaxID=47281 RepID=A0A835XQ74_9CHLO|nr:hypothetical protein HYH03_013360 [Edaphochlamys debaryana]|eukprot:KAG2488056.1 hypothetical protein HYH03_013360 [Edaphochlamys debaryana]